MKKKRVEESRFRAVFIGCPWTIKMSLTKLKRKVDGEHWQCQEGWTLQYFFNGNATCLICKEKVAVLHLHPSRNIRGRNIISSITTRLNTVNIKRSTSNTRVKNEPRSYRKLTSQQRLFHKAKKDADGSQLCGEWINWQAWKPLIEVQFLKGRMLQVADILCPGKESLFNNISLSTNTVAARINELSSDIY